MAAFPDLIVTAPDSPAVRLVVEVKATGVPPPQAEQQLTSYMNLMSCSVGILLTPEILAIYADTFGKRGTDSIEKVVELPSSMLFPIKALKPADEATLEHLALLWLDHLARTGDIGDVSADAHEALSRYVLPAVSGGVVRFAHPKNAHKR